MRKLLLALAAAALSLNAAAQLQGFPFIPQAGGTTNIAVTASAQALTLATHTLPGPLMQLRLITFDSGGGTCATPVFVRSSGTSTVTTDMPVPPKSPAPITITVPASTATLSVISSATGCTLFATVGAGS